MELRDFISSTILEISQGIKQAQVKCTDENLDVLINPDITIGSKGDYVIPDTKKSKYNFNRRVQLLEMDISVTVSETEQNSVSGGAGISKIVKIGVDASTSGSTENTSQNRIKFTIPVAFPAAKVNTTDSTTLITPQ